MSLRINTNVAALNSYNNLSANQTKLEGAFQQLSSGLRINKAADDAAGLSIAQGLTSQINGLTQAVSNANDGINVAQIADGALGTVQDILQRMRGLVVKAGNEGTQDDKSLQAIQKEINNLNTQLDNIASQTKFGQTNLLDGSYNKNFQVGANGGDTIALDLQTSMVGKDAGALRVNASGQALTAAGTIASTDVGGAVGTSQVADVKNGVYASALGAALGGGYTMTLANYYVDATPATDGSVTKTGGLNIVNYDKGGYDMRSEAGAVLKNDGTAGTAGNKEATVYNSAAATADLKAINSAIDSISAARSQIGAVQNQLNYTVTNLQTAITNVTASRSNLTDADLAQQVTSMTQSQILTQAATSVLAQANSAPQAILKLLG